MCRWFYGDVTADHARQILLQAGKHGSFLVRNRQSAADQFALSVRLDDNVHHIIVVYQVNSSYLLLQSVYYIILYYICYIAWLSAQLVDVS